MSLWIRNADKSTAYWLEIAAPDESWHGFIKWDGCVQLYERSIPLVDGKPVPLSEHNCMDECEHYHLDGLADYVLRLTEALEMARKHFGDGWDQP